MTMIPLARFHISIINRHWYKDQVYYDNNIINRPFIKLEICNDVENNFPIRWTPIQSADTLGFSNERMELTRSHLKEKQWYAKVFNFAKVKQSNWNWMKN